MTEQRSSYPEAALLAIAEAADRHVRRHEQPIADQGTTYLRLEEAVKAWRAGAVPSGPAAKWEDAPLPEDDAIATAFPTESGRHDLYAEAMRLVGARFSKHGLVALVTWLLLRAEEPDDTRRIHAQNGALRSFLLGLRGDLERTELNLEEMGCRDEAKAVYAVRLRVSEKIRELGAGT